eukprot:gi/632966747/ref/XP_007899587.1/ PREDICTED: BTB/POZ domain-containing protein KCTD16 [Callorhinchus milii]
MVDYCLLECTFATECNLEASYTTGLFALHQKDLTVLLDSLVKSRQKEAGRLTFVKMSVPKAVFQEEDLFSKSRMSHASPIKGSSSRWPSPQCDCGCRSNKGEKDGESVTSCNELSTSSCDSQSEASSPQETVICGPVTRQPNFQTLDRANKKGPVQHLQQSEFRRKSDLLRTLTSGSRESNTCKKKGKEKMTIEEELEKCIQDFLKIKIPDRFPERKYPWQMDLLRKYHL